VAAHKADIVTLDVFVEIELFDNFVIRAGIEKARAGNGYKMSNISEFCIWAGFNCVAGNIDK
jgi:hypothetical protein